MDKSDIFGIVRDIERGCSLVVERNLPKVVVAVRFRSPAHRKRGSTKPCFCY